MSIVAIIPARGGSKRIPNKNIKLFAGKPIISYSLKTAQETNLFDRVIVSTDSQEIAEVAKTWGGSALCQTGRTCRRLHRYSQSGSPRSEMAGQAE